MSNKYCLKITIVLVLIHCLLPAQQLTTLAVLDFEGLGITEIEAKALTNRLRAILVQAGAYQVVERGKMDAILDEQGFQLSGCTSEECVVEVGQLLGVQKMLAGSISLIGKTYSVEMRIIDVELGRIENTSTFDIKGEIDQLLTIGMKNALNLLLKRDNLSYTSQNSPDISNKLVEPTESTSQSDFLLSVFRPNPKSISNISLLGPDNIESDSMIFVQGGVFLMGNNSGEKDESPVHEIEISSFYIGKYEVNYGKYIYFLNSIGVPSNGISNGYELIVINDPSCAIGYNNGIFYFKGNEYAKYITCPVTGITWNAALEYCKWIGGRLPTEAEWEFAAKGGNLSQGYKYSGSNNINEVAWYLSNSENKPHVVGMLKQNELRIYDFSGNVQEWCSDLYNREYYQNSPKNNPTGPKTGSSHVVRGGSWSLYPQLCRVTYRIGYSLEHKSNDTGFRVCRNAN